MIAVAMLDGIACASLMLYSNLRSNHSFNPSGNRLHGTRQGWMLFEVVSRRVNSGFGRPNYRPCPLLVKMVDAGGLGHNGKGFYDYNQ
jgi:hypothetical protein